MNDPSLHHSLSQLSEETKRLENAYDALQKEFKAHHLVAHLPVGLLSVNQEGIISHYNQGACHLCTIPQEEVIERPYASCFSDTLFGFSMAEALEKKTLNKKIFLEFSTGKKVTVAATFVPQFGVLCLLNDGTELEGAVAHNDRLSELGKMAAALAHEIRNPLGGIEGFASLLYRDLEGEPLQEMAKKILEGTRMLNRLVTNILNYARPCEVHFARVDLLPVIHEVIEWLTPDRTAKPIRLETVLKEAFVMVDKDLFKSALINLLRNAFEATPPGKKVTLHLLSDGKECFLAVKDEGKGISEEEKRRLFTPFFTTKSHGTGLGLVEAHKAITALGGKITVDSKKGEGATFTIRLNHDA